MLFSTRQLVIAAVLAAVSIVLVMTPAGLIPVPNIAGSATTVHIPTIVGGILAGPLVGAILGLVLAFATIPFFLALGVNLVACFLPRVFIGVVAHFLWIQGGKSDKAVIISALGATGVNTYGVLGLALAFQDLSWEVVAPVIALNGTLELILSAVIVLPVIRLLNRQGRYV